MRRSERIALLMFRHIRGELSDAEFRELTEWRNLSTENEQVFREETDADHIRNEMKEMYANKNAIFQKIKEKYPELSNHTSVTRRRRAMPMTVALIIIVSVGIFFLALNQTKKATSLPVKMSYALIKPGGNHAVLTLASGSSILLDSLASGFIAGEGSITITKSDSGQLQYAENGISTGPVNSFNVLTTPRGGQFELILPDGTKVWLNASSSLRYPSSFNDLERRVELNGEAYFEVSRINSRFTKQRTPFLVSVTGKPDVRVLGTHFNIMAYKDEPLVSTTLLEGSVKIGSTILKPGQQAQIKNNGTEITVISDVDLNAVTAWKNGKTVFKDASIQEIMRAISRWYDVDIEYKGVIPDKKYKGGLPRNTDLTELLEVLNQNGIHFTVTGKKIIVTP